MKATSQQSTAVPTKKSAQATDSSSKLDAEVAKRLKEAFQRNYAESPRAALIFAVCYTWYGSGAKFRGDCSGFARQVANILGISGCEGNADSMFSALAGTPWNLIGEGKAAAEIAAARADSGHFVLAATPASIARASADGTKHGHVAIVLGERTLEEVKVTGKEGGAEDGKLELRKTPKGSPAGSWGQYGSIGMMFSDLRKSFSPSRVGNNGVDVSTSEEASRFGRVRYASQAIPDPRTIWERILSSLGDMPPP